MMDEVASDIEMKVKSLSETEKKWKVSILLNERLYIFLSMMALIPDLRNEAMRDRHWKELRIEVKEDFDENDASFTLERVFSLGLLQHTDKINEIVSHASQQLKIEQGLNNIEEKWERSAETNLDIVVTYTKGSAE
jgi:dynein heavy chain